MLLCHNQYYPNYSFLCYCTLGTVGSDRKQTTKKPALGACDLLHFLLCLMNTLNETESDVCILLCSFLILKRSIFTDHREVAALLVLHAVDRTILIKC